ncbi:hypothetical protein MARI151_60173 [Maribacter litoralis]|uniref:Uncharacterized protein n=1 Tax=Maribacter litoralis TaxID=2059726 RepID=A0A653W8B0_9FLAO|nr:hypothetical protein MARI151_60173 [Maribacter litoralis]
MSKNPYFTTISRLLLSKSYSVAYTLIKQIYLLKYNTLEKYICNDFSEILQNYLLRN